MAEATKISWAHSTLNFWIGCQKVSPACDGCYAEEMMANRYGRVQWGPHGARVRTKTWGDAAKWQRQAPAFMAEHGCRRRVFVNSLSDFFDNHRSVVWRDEAWAIIRACPDLDWLLLTKRPQNIRKMLPDDWGAGYPNVWLGTTVENQTEADRRIPHLLEVPAAVRFLSCEPLLGPVDLTPHLWGRATPCPGCPKDADCDCGYLPRHMLGEEPDIAWVITGGESGKDARPSHPDWFRSLRDQCAAARVAFHHKQNGEWQDGSDFEHPHREHRIVYTDGRNGPHTEQYARSQDLEGLHNGFNPTVVARVGTKRSGHLLDGVEHRAVPA